MITTKTSEIIAASAAHRTIQMDARSLRVHPTAQRDLVKSNLKHLVQNMDLDAIGVMHAVEHTIDGQHGIWVIDGQHRLLALLELGLGEWLLEVVIHDDVTDSARASDVFLKLNRRSPVGPFDTFRNQIKAGHPHAVGSERLVEKFGMKCSPASADGNVACVVALKAAFSVDDGRSLECALWITTSAWGRTATAVEGSIIAGLTRISKLYSGVLDGAALIKKLSKYQSGAAGVISDARGLRKYKKASMDRCVAEIIVNLYNAGRREGKLGPV